MAKHENIVKLEDMIIESKEHKSRDKRPVFADFKLYLVFEYVPHDLFGISQRKPNFSLS
jgi:serine/threonine protein kinase